MLFLLIIFLGIVGSIAGWIFKLLYHRLCELDMAGEAVYGVRVADTQMILIWCLGGFVSCISVCTLPIYIVASVLFVRYLIRRTSPPFACQVFFVYLGLSLCAVTGIGALAGILAAKSNRQQELANKLRLQSDPNRGAFL